MSSKSAIDFYEFLQISPRADQDTIHRVYRFLASRFHPDNPESGDAETFSTLSAAYETLSDPDRRVEYDTNRETEAAQPPPLSSSIDFMDSVAGELNRRLAVLAVLYFKRRANPLYPEVSLTDLENRMGFPRDYLDFTTWYLQKKGYITRADNADFTLTATGVDFVEMQRANIPVLNKLLTDGVERLRPHGSGHSETTSRPGPTEIRRTPRMIILPDNTCIPDRRKSSRDRRGADSEHRLEAGEERRMHG
ncbi:MAG: J domain-containing protein [Acidobacteriaceae bacterium]